MRNFILALALVVGCGGTEVAREGSAAVDAAPAPSGDWACPIDGSKLNLSPAGTYVTPARSGGYAVEGRQLAFSVGLDGFCQLTGTVFWFTVASSTSDFTGAEMWLSAPGQVCPLAHVP